MAFIKKQAAVYAAARAMNVNRTPASQGNTAFLKQEDSASTSILNSNTTGPDSVLRSSNENGQAIMPADGQKLASQTSDSYPIRQSWEYVEEVVQILKTAFPLLILSMETMVDQINQRFKATPEEEIYRLTCMLLQDAMQVSKIHDI
jgi:transformation/transcription domain-associated protein